jgi:hypothetical protein
MSIRSDLSALDRQYRAKRTGQSRIEYAASIEKFRRPVSLKTRTLQAAAVLLVLGAIYLGAIA